jgi:hypothetical protein
MDLDQVVWHSLAKGWNVAQLRVDVTIQFGACRQDEGKALGEFSIAQRTLG